MSFSQVWSILGLINQIYGRAGMQRDMHSQTKLLPYLAAFTQDKQEHGYSDVFALPKAFREIFNMCSYKKNERAGGVAQVVDALNSVLPSTPYKKIKTKTTNVEIYL
jgi:hypothetical protein